MFIKKEIVIISLVICSISLYSQGVCIGGTVEKGVCQCPPGSSSITIGGMTKCSGDSGSASLKADRLKNQADGLIAKGSCNGQCNDSFQHMQNANECVKKIEKCKSDVEAYEKKQKECDAMPSGTDKEKCLAEANKLKAAANSSCEDADAACKKCSDSGVEGLAGKDGNPPTSSDVGKAFDKAVSNLSAKIGAYKGCCSGQTGGGCRVMPAKYSRNNHSGTDTTFLIAILIALFLPGLAIVSLKLLTYIRNRQSI